jgi:hypothetical protein
MLQSELEHTVQAAGPGGVAEHSLSSLSHTLCPVPYTSLSLSVYFLLPRSLRLTTASFLSLGLNPESASGIREDLMFLRSREARPEPAKT